MNSQDETNQLLYITTNLSELALYFSTDILDLSSTTDEWINQHDILIVSEISQDEPPLISLSFNIKITIATAIILAIIVGSYFKSIMYSYVYTTNKNNRGWMHRPINVLTISSAIIHHLTHALTGAWYLVMLMAREPLGASFGFNFCERMDKIYIYGLIYLSVGSLGIAIYRLFYIKLEHWVKYVIGERLLLLILLSLSIMVTAILTAVFTLESSSDRYQLNMCRGTSVTHAQILIDYALSSGDQTLNTNIIQKSIAIVCIIIQGIEFGIYIWFFYTRYKNDNGTIKRLLTQDSVRERNIKNIGTFLGQFYGFVMEFAFLVTILVLIIFADEHTHHLKAYVAVTKLCEFGLLSAIEVISSPELRSFIK